MRNGLFLGICNSSLKDCIKMPYVAKTINILRDRIYEKAYLADCNSVRNEGRYGLIRCVLNSRLKIRKEALPDACAVGDKARCGMRLAVEWVVEIDINQIGEKAVGRGVN